MNKLEEIAAYKKKQVASDINTKSIKQLEESPFYERDTTSMHKSILNGSGVIAEFKRKSPSKGVINDVSSVKEVVEGYDSAGVSGVSVLTDLPYFGGEISDVIQARECISKPVLRKEFIVDEYQIIEAKAIGADCILLIAEILTKEEVYAFSTLAKSLGLDVLMELHSEDQLDKLCSTLDIVGVNNRNLKTFEVDINISINLFDAIGNDFIRISESGISDVKEAIVLKKEGFDGFLIGENFMKTENPGNACAEFINQLHAS